ncbi:C4-dicarboxylate ABC transporter permease, partial [[Clostridium] symbiosum]|nr:C4-dicarboxylate ABC transporter permease [[Clostridium] symbiosum]
LDFAMPPVILGLILGTKNETNLSKSLAISDGSFSIFFTRPISCVLLIIAAFSLLSPVLVPMLKRAAGRTGK